MTRWLGSKTFWKIRTMARSSLISPSTCQSTACLKSGKAQFTKFTRTSLLICTPGSSTLQASNSTSIICWSSISHWMTSHSKAPRTSSPVSERLTTEFRYGPTTPWLKTMPMVIASIKMRLARASLAVIPSQRFTMPSFNIRTLITLRSIRQAGGMSRMPSIKWRLITGTRLPLFFKITSSFTTLNS